MPPAALSIIDLLGLGGMVQPRPAGGIPETIPVEAGLGGIADDIDRATREWIASTEVGRTEPQDHGDD